MTTAQSQNEILVSLAARNNAVPYDMLMTALGIPNEREFEDFIIQAIYQEVIQCRLNPVKRRLEITDWGSEGLAASDLEQMVDTLQHWSKHCSELISTMGNKMIISNHMVAECAVNEKRVAEEAEHIEKLLSSDELHLRKFWSMDKDIGGSGSANKATGQKPDTKRFKSGFANKKRGGNN